MYVQKICKVKGKEVVELISEKYPGTFYVMNWRWGESIQKESDTVMALVQRNR